MTTQYIAAKISACTAACLIAILFLGCGGSGSGSGGSNQPSPPLSAQFVMDGLVDLSNMDNVHSMTVDFVDFFAGGPPVKSTQLQWAMANDDRYLYVALTWNDDTYNHQFDAVGGPLDFDGVQLLFDNDGDGLYEIGEDQRTVIAASVASQFIDQHLVASGDATDRIGDGTARLSYDATSQSYQAEFFIPLVEDANNQDGILNAQSRYSIVLMDHVQLGASAGFAATTWGQGPSAALWETIDFEDAVAHAYPQMPSNLTGLIVFLSSHEEANREVYSFDPADGTINRITHLPGLFKDGVSLSHDRQTVAFFAAPSSTDFNNYEIYTVKTDGSDGSSPNQLTSNAILDGHPAWSPDDSHIAYASFRDAGQASIIVMTADGTEVADLTPPGFDDNDPEYLPSPDGRIMFKTDRFSTFPQVGIAVMNADGSGVTQITAPNGFSDHDPVGENQWCVFERFNKPTNYAIDPETGFTPWDIIEARLDGGQERILMEDGWLNWLPIYSPDGHHILYLKSQPHTAAHIMTRQGQEIGRLIPGITSIGYIDWK